MIRLYTQLSADPRSRRRERVVRPWPIGPDHHPFPHTRNPRPTRLSVQHRAPRVTVRMRPSHAADAVADPPAGNASMNTTDVKLRGGVAFLNRNRHIG